MPSKYAIIAESTSIFTRIRNNTAWRPFVFGTLYFVRARDAGAHLIDKGAVGYL